MCGTSVRVSMKGRDSCPVLDGVHTTSITMNKRIKSKPSRRLASRITRLLLSFRTSRRPFHVPDTNIIDISLEFERHVMLFTSECVIGIPVLRGTLA